VLVEHSFERVRSAAVLPAHRNTLRDRINRISEITVVDLNAAPGRGLAWIERATNALEDRVAGPLGSGRTRSAAAAL
jgi:hypothetical protein